MEMSAGEAEAASAVFALDCPCDVLRKFELEDCFFLLGVACVRAVAALGGLVRRDCAEDGGDALHVFAEAHVVVPFVGGAEGFYAVADRVFWKCGEVGLPVRVHAPPLLEVSAEPVEEFGRAFADGAAVWRWGGLGGLAVRAGGGVGPVGVLVSGLDGVVEADEAAAALHFLVELLKMIADYGGVAATAVGVNKDGARGGHFFGRGPLGVELHFHRYAVRSALFEALGEELDAGVVLMLAGAVRWTAGDHEDVLFVGSEAEGGDCE